MQYIYRGDFMQQHKHSYSFPELTDEERKKLITYIKKGIYKELNCLGLINDEQLSYLFELINNN